MHSWRAITVLSQPAGLQAVCRLFTCSNLAACCAGLLSASSTGSILQLRHSSSRPRHGRVPLRAAAAAAAAAADGGAADGGAGGAGAPPAAQQQQQQAQQPWQPKQKPPRELSLQQRWRAIKFGITETQQRVAQQLRWVCRHLLPACPAAPHPYCCCATAVPLSPARQGDTTACAVLSCSKTSPRPAPFLLLPAPQPSSCGGGAAGGPGGPEPAPAAAVRRLEGAAEGAGGFGRHVSLPACLPACHLGWVSQPARQQPDCQRHCQPARRLRPNGLPPNLTCPPASTAPACLPCLQVQSVPG